MSSTAVKSNFFSPLIFLAAMMGVLITFVAVTFTYYSLLQQEHDIHNARLVLIKEEIVRKVDALDEISHGMRTLFDASSEVESDEFRLLAENILTRHSHITSTSYLPRVAFDQKEKFEAEIREKGLIGFRIREVNDPSSVNDNATASDFYPVMFREPFTPISAKSLGLSYNTVPDFDQVIHKAISTSQATSSTHVPLKSSANEFVVIKAIYAGKDTPGSVEERMKTATGLVMLTVDGSKLLSSQFVKGVSFKLSLLDQLGENTIVENFIHGEKPSLIFPTWSEATFNFSSGTDGFRLATKIPVYIQGDKLVLLFGVLLVGLMVTALLYLQARSIAARTATLQQQHHDIKGVAEARAKELAWEKEKAHITLESIADAVITTDAHGRVDYLNPVAEKLTGWNEADALGKDIRNVFRIINEDNEDTVENPILASLRSSSVSRARETVCVLGRNGEKTAVEIVAAPILGKENTPSGAVLISHDVSLAKQMASQMEFQATHDSLTTLPNRTLLIDRLNQAISRGPWNKKKIAVLFLDLDRFKLVNDTRGHNVGDELLRHVANRLVSCLREGDTVSRLGGDEFVIVLHEVAAVDDVQALAQKIINIFKQPFMLGEEEFFTTASVGISIYPQDGDDSLTLMKKSDAAMYQAKAAGKNNFVFYSEEMIEQNKKTLSIEMELRRALERSEFELYYQPQVNSLTREVVGAEALLRWKHPQLGVVSPMDFIPIAEETGLIIPLGDWVIQKACAHRKLWYELGNTTLRVSVNISGVQFQHGGFLSKVEKALTETGLESKLLELELTEGILAEDSEMSAATLDKIKAMGVHMSIDDFGTGYSSLAYLKRFPVSTLKVDRCFVKDITTDADDAAICSTVIAMAHNLNLRVIAEGVEEEEQLEFLLAHHCDAIQGYYFSPPITESEFRKYLFASELHSEQSSEKKEQIPQPAET